MTSQTESIRERWRRSPGFLLARRETQPFLDAADDMVRLRIRLGLSQEQLAERAGTKQANISRIEAGLANPTLKVLQRIAEALDSDLIVAMRPRGPASELPPEAEETAEADGPVLVVNYPLPSGCGSVQYRSTASQQKVEV